MYICLVNSTCSAKEEIWSSGSDDESNPYDGLTPEKRYPLLECMPILLKVYQSYLLCTKVKAGSAS